MADSKKKKRPSLGKGKAEKAAKAIEGRAERLRKAEEEAMGNGRRRRK